MIIKYGVEVYPRSTGEILVDMDDLIFYEVAMEKREEGAYLVTGNKKIDVFYTDSYNDKALMKISKKVFLVKNGTPVKIR